ncbi:tetratricopeptide repeat protein [Pararhizobium sp. O133]|uniref:tetratricopeptide repeat protein n=1 Tax=Pararhizobium sp. O133 TaxID=3449278 RepID=UPI003F686B12
MSKSRKTDGMRKSVYSNDFLGPCMDSPADEIVDNAWDADTLAKRIKFARQALDLDLDALDAYNLLGIHAATHAERIALFREAVRIGERQFAPYIAETAGQDAEEAGWWSFIGTRPWMRAQHNLGLALLEAGDRQEAISVFQTLLKLNPNDNQGIRMLLMRIAAEDGDYGACKLLFVDYPDDWSLDFIATRLLVDIATRKKIDFAAHFAAIGENNRYLLPLLSTAAKADRWPRPPQTDMITFGSKDAAAIYLDAFRKAWQRRPTLLEQFRQAYEADRPNALKKEAP